MDEQLWTAEELREIKERFSQAFPPGFDGVIIHDKIKILAADPTLAKMFGYELPEITDKTVLELTIPEARSLIVRKILLKQDEPYETIALKKDGTTFPVEICSRAIADQERPVRAMAIRAIPEREQTEMLEVLQKAKSELEINLKESTTQLRYVNERLRLDLKERKQIEAELKTRARQQAAVAELGQRALVGTALPLLLDEVTALVNQTLEIEYSAILELMPAGDTLLLRTGLGWRNRFIGQAMVRASAESQAGYTLLSGRPVIVEDLAKETRFNPSSLLRHHHVVSGMSVIIQGQHLPFGVLAAHTIRQRTFTEDDIHFLQAIANILAMAIERKRAEAQVVQRNREADALRQAGAALSSTLNYEAVLDRILEQVGQMVPHDTADLMLIEGDTAHIFRSRGYDQFGGKDIVMSISFNIADTPTLRIMRETNQPLAILDVTNYAAWIHRPETAWIQSCAGTPIHIRGQVIGFLNVNSATSGFFSQADADHLQAFASQAAIAIENARLYDEIRHHAAELSRLNEISQAIISTLDLQEMLAIITARTTQLLGVAATAVALYDETQGDLWFTAAYGQGSDFVQGKRLGLGQGLVGWVIQQGEPVLIPDVSKDPRFFSDFDRASGFTTHSILCVPLQTKGQIIGAIEVMNKASRPFDQQDLQLLNSLAAPAAAALENARLFEQAQQEIAERKRAEAALQEERAWLAWRVAERTADLSAANAELARAARLKDEFLANMSHELRTPLTAVLGFAEILTGEVYGPLTEKQRESVSQIDESGRHLVSLINDILDLAKIEADKLELEIDSVQVKAVCQASLQFIKQIAHQKQLTISSTYGESTLMLQADERRLKQILVNLLSNAVKFTPEGGEIGLEVIGDAARQVIHFTVWDTGIGISQEDITQLFQPFLQLDSRLSRQYTGTGLGLVLVRRMVEMHGGTVMVESDGVPGLGSRFTVSLPWHEALEADRETEKAEPEVDVPSLISSPAQLPLILLAEDEEAISILLSDYLVGCGYRIAVARNGVEALEQAKAERPNLIVMDVHMPKMDGLEAIRLLRADTALAYTPIITLTALVMSGDREKCLQAGANEYLSKPVSLKELARVIQTQLHQD